MTKPKRLDPPPKYEPGFIARLDSRTGIAKILRANFEAVANDLGGVDELSHVQSALVERFVFLQATLSKIEADMVEDPEEASEIMGRWIQAVNSLTGLAKTLGIKRVASKQNWVVS